MNAALDVLPNPQSPSRSRKHEGEPRNSNERRYPRSGGTLLPSELEYLRVGDDIGLGPRTLMSGESPEMRARLGRRVVERLAKTAHALPRHILELEVPPPPIVLDTFLIDERTRRALERMQPYRDTQPWTLARYLELPRFGPRCLVDLLAARAEKLATQEHTNHTAPSVGAKAIDWGGTRVSLASETVMVLDLISRFLSQRTPVGMEQIHKHACDHGLKVPAATLADLLLLYRKSKRTPPFRIASLAGAEVAVRPHEQRSSGAISITATHFIDWWGLAPVESVASRSRLVTGCAISERTIHNVLEVSKGFVWLDDERTWFTFRQRDSSLLRLLTKMLTIGEWFDLVRVQLQVGKCQAQVRDVPRSVFARYLRTAVNCQIRATWARRRRPDDGPDLERPLLPVRLASPRSHYGRDLR